MLIYGAMNLLAFGVVIAAARRTNSAELGSFAGLFSYAPGLTVAMTIALASLAGIPPLGGWFAKFVVFRALVSPGTVGGTSLALVMAVNSVIAFYYYGLVLKEMWFKAAPDGDTSPIRIPPSLQAALGLTGLATIVFGVVPGVITHFTDFTSLLTAGS